MQREDRGQKGFVLITVLLTIVLLTAVLVQFNCESRLGLRAVDDYLAQRQALACARAGYELALATIAKNPQISTNETLHGLLTQEKSITLGSGQCTVSVEQENGKLNINAFKDRDNRLERTRIDQMLRLNDLLNQNRQTDISYAVAPAIIDWTDADDQVTRLSFIANHNEGAESDHYARLPQPYRCSNRPFEILDEALLVRSMTESAFYGDRAGGEQQQRYSNGLADYLTVYGDGQIDINAASKLILQSISPAIDATLATMIVEQRDNEPFEKLTQLQHIAGMTDAAYAALGKVTTTRPRDHYYLVKARGTFAQADMTITAIVRHDGSAQRVMLILYQENSGRRHG